MTAPSGSRIASFMLACAMFAVICFCLRSCQGQIDYHRPVEAIPEAYR